ncbi:MAG: pyridoxamine 5'-phosphate oxidase family protein [Myxococcota bacterium]
MAGKRDLIRMSDEEIRDFIENARTMIIVSNGKDGYPHAMPMWFVIRDGCPLLSTFAKSQKVLNVRRDPRVTALVESGVEYDKLKGVMIRGKGEIIESRATVEEIQLAFANKYVGGPFPEGAEEVIRARANKRVVIRIVPEKFISWDHTRLGGAY